MHSAADNLANVGLELGGKSPSIVFADCDFDKAVEWVMFGCFWTNGQVRCAVSDAPTHIHTLVRVHATPTTHAHPPTHTRTHNRTHTRARARAPACCAGSHACAHRPNAAHTLHRSARRHLGFWCTKTSPASSWTASSSQ